MALTTSKPAAFVDGTASSASAVNTAINTAGGLYVVTQKTFSAAASTSVDDCFTAAAWAYRVIISANAATGGTWSIRLRAAGADNSTASSYWNKGVLYYQATDQTGSNHSNTTSWSPISNAGFTVISFDIFRPFESQPTFIVGQAFSADQHELLTFGGQHTATSSFDGFTVSPNSGTFDGDIIVLAYRGDK